MSSHAADHAAATTASAQSAALLTSYLDLQSTQHQTQDAIGAWLDALKAAKDARSQLDRFIATCTGNGDVTLPKSMRISLKARAKFPSVANAPTFFDAAHAALLTIEREATEKAFKVLKEVKEQHVAHLRQQANVPSFVARATAEHRTRVLAYASKLAASPAYSADVSASFPTDAAVDAFSHTLSASLASHAASSISHSLNEEKQMAAATSASHQAAEVMLQGATTGTTIAAIVDASVRKQLAAVRTTTTPHAAGAATPRDTTDAATRSPINDRAAPAHGLRVTQRPRFKPAGEQRRSHERKHQTDSGQGSQQNVHVTLHGQQTIRRRHPGRRPDRDHTSNNSHSGSQLRVAAPPHSRPTAAAANHEEPYPSRSTNSSGGGRSTGGPKRNRSAEDRRQSSTTHGPPLHKHMRKQ